MSGFKPGDVAMVDGYVSVRANSDAWYRSAPKDVLLVDSDVPNVRPLVVIDPEDREQVERFTSLLGWAMHPDDADNLADALREFANPTPPKPAEPTGLGAVVEDADGRHFVRQVDGWWRGDEPCSLNWAAVPAVRVLSEGVTL